MASPPPDREPVHIDMTVAHTARGVRLPAGRHRQLRDRPRGRRPRLRDLPRRRGRCRPGRRPGQPRLPAPGRALPRARGGLRQFLDIGTGIPNADNTHAVAHEEAPDVPGRLRRQRPDRAGARPRPALRTPRRRPTSTATSATRRRSSPTRRPRSTSPSRSPWCSPALLHVIPDSDDPYGCVGALLAAVPSGSYLALSHLTTDIAVGAMATVTSRLDETMHTTNPPAFRSLDQVTGSSPASNWSSRAWSRPSRGAPSAARSPRAPTRVAAVRRGRPQALTVAHRPPPPCGAASHGAEGRGEPAGGLAQLGGRGGGERQAEAVGVGAGRRPAAPCGLRPRRPGRGRRPRRRRAPGAAGRWCPPPGRSPGPTRTCRPRARRRPAGRPARPAGAPVRAVGPRPVAAGQRGQVVGPGTPASSPAVDEALAERGRVEVGGLLDAHQRRRHHRGGPHVARPAGRGTAPSTPSPA